MPSGIPVKITVSLGTCGRRLRVWPVVPPPHPLPTHACDFCFSQQLFRDVGLRSIGQGAMQAERWAVIWLAGHRGGSGQWSPASTQAATTMLSDVLAGDFQRGRPPPAQAQPTLWNVPRLPLLGPERGLTGPQPQAPLGGPAPRTPHPTALLSLSG